MFLAFGLALIGIGFMRIFLLDVAWEFTKLNNEIKGRVPERTRSWEGATVVSGIIAVVIGLFLSCYGVDEVMKEREREKQIASSQRKNLDDLNQPIILGADGTPLRVDEAIMPPYVEEGSQSMGDNQVVTIVDPIHARGFYTVPITQTADSTSQVIMNYYTAQPLVSDCSASATILACKIQHGAFYLTLAKQSNAEVVVEWDLTIE